MYIALEVGIGMGAVLTAWIYDNDVDRLPYSFLLAASFALVAVIYLIFFQRKQLRLSEK
jgi:predicted MFS family arabinose efflux permease